MYIILANVYDIEISEKRKPQEQLTTTKPVQLNNLIYIRYFVFKRRSNIFENKNVEITLSSY